MEAFLSQLDILRLSEDKCLHYAQSSFVLAKIGFALAKPSLRQRLALPWQTKDYSCFLSVPSLQQTPSFTTTNSFAKAKVSLLLGEPEASILQSSTSHRRSSLFALANFFTTAKVFLRLGKAVPSISGSTFLTFCPFVV